MTKLRQLVLAATLMNFYIVVPTYAQSVCGDAPPTIPNLDKSSSEKIDADLKGSAQSLFKAALNTNLDGKIKIEKEKIYQEYNSVDKYLLKQRLLFITCNLVMNDINMATEKKLEYISNISDKILQ